MLLVRRPIKVIRKGYRWHVLRVEGSYEKKTSLALHFYGTTGIIPHYELIQRLWVPEVTVKYFSKSGATKERRTPMVPGYLFVEAILSYQLYASLKKPNFPHMFGWLQTWKSWPVIVPQADIRRLALLEVRDPEPPELAFGVGDKVVIPSLGIRGIVLAITQQSVTLDIELFHRNIPFRVGHDFFAEIIRVV